MMGALVAATTAVAAAYAGLALRRYGMRRWGQTATGFVEDAAVLARCLDGIDAAGGAEALRRYESVRQARTAKIQTTSFGNRDLFHMPDGQMQRDRDEILASGVGGLSMLDWVYGYDPVTAPIWTATAT